MSKDPEKANEDTTQTAIGILEILENSYSKSAEEHRRRIDLTKGIALGLIYGIIGNLFVQFFYPVFERVILRNFDIVFWSNLIVSAFALAIILLVTFEFRRQLKKDEFSTKHIESIIQALRENLEKQKQSLRRIQEERKESK